MRQSSIILFLFSTILIAQSSSLVSVGSSGKLEYKTFANTGQTNSVNKIPDFSFAGYKGGGVVLPVVPVVETLNPISGDAKSLIQSAIDRISLLPLNSNGFRGAILLKSGKYDVNGVLEIKASGVVLRGEGQNTPDKKGTELFASSKTQHDFIQLIGNEISSASNSETILDTKQFPSARTWQDFDVRKGVTEELDGDKIISFHLTADANQYVNYSSKEDSLQYRPYLEITTKSSSAILKIYPSADTYVQGGTNSKNNYGTETSVAVKNSGATSSVTREGYLRFDLSIVKDSVTKAALKMFARKDLAGDPAAIKIVFITVSVIDNDSWDELTLNYDSRPGASSASSKKIISEYVASGSNAFDIDNVAGLSVGDTITVTRTPNDSWINTLDMAQYGWIASEYRVSYERIITGIKGNTITINIPLVQAIETKFGGGEITKISVKGRLFNSGVENILITSFYTDDNDESHGWSAITLSKTTDCWVRKVTARYFGYSCVGLYWAYNTTVEECAMLDPKSITTGSRKYSFYIDKGSFNLFQRCYTRGGRHDYITGSRVAGPNVFVDCYSTQTYADIGPHHRYATGILFDNIRGGETRVQNRKEMGSGHGWAGAQTMFWNCQSDVSEFKVESPIGAMNWGIGCKGVLQNGAGFWESWGTNISLRSLYFQQLQDRLGLKAVENVTISEQRKESIWNSLSKWAGIGDYSVVTGIQSEGKDIPSQFILEQNYPNPFNPETIITFRLSSFSRVSLTVYDLLGREVIKLLDEYKQPGIYHSMLNAKEQQLSSGVYLYTLRCGNNSETKKLVVVK